MEPPLLKSPAPAVAVISTEARSPDGREDEECESILANLDLLFSLLCGSMYLQVQTMSQPIDVSSVKAQPLMQTAAVRATTNAVLYTFDLGWLAKAEYDLPHLSRRFADCAAEVPSWQS